MWNVLRRIALAIVALAIVAGPAVVLTGCEKDEIRFERKVEIKNVEINRDTVVE